MILYSEVVWQNWQNKTGERILFEKEFTIKFYISTINICKLLTSTYDSYIKSKVFFKTFLSSSRVSFLIYYPKEILKKIIIKNKRRKTTS